MLEFRETSYACPEQYDIYYKDEQVGYLRYRNGTLTVDYPKCDGDRLLTGYIGDPYAGRFSDDERNYYLHMAAAAISERIGILDYGYKIIDKPIDNL